MAVDGDTDMVFAPNTLEALLVNANADKDSEHYAPIVGGLCFAVNDGKLEPTMYQLVKGDDGAWQPFATPRTPRTPCSRCRRRARPAC